MKLLKAIPNFHSSYETRALNTRAVYSKKKGSKYAYIPKIDISTISMSSNERKSKKRLYYTLFSRKTFQQFIDIYIYAQTLKQFVTRARRYSRTGNPIAICVLSLVSLSRANKSSRTQTTRSSKGGNQTRA